MAQELFYRGILLRFSPGTGRGTVRTASGREIPFDLDFVTLARSFRERPRQVLREGMEVGLDIGRTSRGVCVSRLFPVEDGSVAVDEDEPAGREGAS